MDVGGCVKAAMTTMAISMMTVMEMTMMVFMTGPSVFVHLRAAAACPHAKQTHAGAICMRPLR
eukprot:1546155-Pyramimonas_sp.AAC.2